MLAISLVAALAFVQQQPLDPKELIRQSVLNYEKAWRAGIQWSYTQTDVTCDDGTKEVDVSQVIPLDGTPYQRLVSKNGHALAPEEQRQEDEKYRKELRRRESESPAERQARIDKYAQQRAFLMEVPEAYNFRLEGDDLVAGRPAWIVHVTPRPGFEPTMPHANMLRHIDGRLWIDKQDIQWAKAEAEVIDTVAIGVILARIGPGARITLDFTRVSDSLWVPKELTIKGEARVLLVHTKNLDEQLTFSGYHIPQKNELVSGYRQNNSECCTSR
jgi:hypothetical protein